MNPRTCYALVAGLCGLEALFIPLSKWPSSSACLFCGPKPTGQLLLWCASGHQAGLHMDTFMVELLMASTVVWWPCCAGPSGLLCSHPLPCTWFLLWGEEQGRVHMHHPHHREYFMFGPGIFIYTRPFSEPSQPTRWLSLPHSDLSSVKTLWFIPQPGSKSICEKVSLVSASLLKSREMYMKIMTGEFHMKWRYSLSNTTFIDHLPFVETVLGPGRKSYYWGW